MNKKIRVRICLAAHFEISETNEALIRYGMEPLYARTAAVKILKRKSARPSL